MSVLQLTAKLTVFSMKFHAIPLVRNAAKFAANQKPSTNAKKEVVKLNPEAAVETDPNKLLSFVCGSNIDLKGEDIKLQPDSKYPAWLWDLQIVHPKIEELDASSKQYWIRVRAEGMRSNNRVKKLKKI